jgi:hypothetical protein
MNRRLTGLPLGATFALAGCGSTLLASRRANLRNGSILQRNESTQTCCLRLKFSVPPNDIPRFQLSPALPGTCVKP